MRRRLACGGVHPLRQHLLLLLLLLKVLVLLVLVPALVEGHLEDGGGACGALRGPAGRGGGSAPLCSHRPDLACVCHRGGQRRRCRHKAVHDLQEGVARPRCQCVQLVYQVLRDRILAQVCRNRPPSFFSLCSLAMGARTTTCTRCPSSSSRRRAAARSPLASRRCRARA